MDLTGEEIDIGTLTKIEPRVIVNQNLTTQEIKVRGSNFTGNGTDNNITITLVSSGGVNIPVSGITVDDPNTVRFTADFTGASSEEYILTLTHSPITSSSSIGSSNIWLTDTIQAAIVKASSIYTSEMAAGKISASTSDPGWIEAYIPAGTYNPTPLDTENTLGLSSGVYLKGAGGDPSTGTHIIAAANTRHFYAYNNFDIALDSLRLTGGNTSDYGGVLYAYNIKGKWLITNSVMDGNNSSYNGGALYFDRDTERKDANISITDNTFSGNTAEDHGGAIFIQPSSYGDWILTITGNTINENIGQDSGGGIYIYQEHSGGEYTISNNIITGNYATNYGSGGGLYMYLSDTGGSIPLQVSVENNKITGNYSTSHDSNDRGGGIYAEISDGISVDIKGNTISGNGNYSGGGLYLDVSNNSSVNVSGNNITGNAATANGAGIKCDASNDSLVNITDNEISENGEDNTIGTENYGQNRYGGGIYAIANETLYINRNNIYSNIGILGDGAQLLYLSPSPVLDATNNWWGSGVSPEANSVVYNYSGGTVTVSPYASGQFTVPVTP